MSKNKNYFKEMRKIAKDKTVSVKKKVIDLYDMGALHSVHFDEVHSRLYDLEKWRIKYEERIAVLEESIEKLTKDVPVPVHIERTVPTSSTDSGWGNMELGQCAQVGNYNGLCEWMNTEICPHFPGKGVSKRVRQGTECLPHREYRWMMHLEMQAYQRGRTEGRKQTEEETKNEMDNHRKA